MFPKTLKVPPVKISSAELSVICHFSIFSCLNTGSGGSCSMTSSLEWGKWWQQSQLQTVRRHTHFPLWAFMWLYIRHSWVLVRPGVFTQRWVPTPGTGCSSRAGASGAALLIGASGRNSEGQMHWTEPLELWISAPELQDLGQEHSYFCSMFLLFFLDGSACKYNRNVCVWLEIMGKSVSFPRPKISPDIAALMFHR